MAQNRGMEDWNQQRLDLQKNGMLVLGSWALANFAYSGYSMTQTRGNTFYFHQMNVFWNTVNAGIAVGGYISAINGDMGLSEQQTLAEVNKFSKILLFNTGLDVAYMATGLYLRERSKNVSKYSNRLKGYGNSLLIQGGFLFFFDLALVFLNENMLQEIMQNQHIKLSMYPGGLQFIYSF